MVKKSEGVPEVGKPQEEQKETNLEESKEEQGVTPWPENPQYSDKSGTWTGQDERSAEYADQLLDAALKGSSKSETPEEAKKTVVKKISGAENVRRKYEKGKILSQYEAAQLRKPELFGDGKEESDKTQKEQVVSVEEKPILPQPPEQLPIEKEAEIIPVAQEPKPKTEFARIIPAKEKKEDENIGGREFNLKNQYVELFKDLQKGVQPAKDIYDTIEEDKNQLAEFYGPQVREKTNLLFEKLKKPPKKGEEKEKLDYDSRQLKRLYFELLKSKKNKEEPPQEILDKIKSQEDKIYERELRNEVGPIFDRINMEAMKETGYKSTEKKEKSTKTSRIKVADIDKEEEAKRQEQELTKKRWQLAEKYDLKNVEEIKKFIKDHTKK